MPNSQENHNFIRYTLFQKNNFQTMLGGQKKWLS
jgi:hypothetical protein